jgi:phosphatidylglycerophosphatase A
MSIQAPQATEQAQIPFLTKLVATGFYSGYAPIAPGTAGSIVAVALYFLPVFELPLILSVVTLIVFFIGTFVSSQMEKILGDDPPVVVIDEIVGQWITFLFLPEKTMLVVILGFFFFRAYDIFKPPPARYVEKFKNGWGIMLDDVVAGIYANISLWMILWAYELYKSK